MVYSENIELFKLYNMIYMTFKSFGGIILKILIQKIFPYIFHIFWVYLQLHLQFLTEWYILS